MPMPGKSQKVGANRMNRDSNLVAILMTGLTKATVHKMETDTNGEDGPAIILSFSQISRAGVWATNLSAMTKSELQALKEIVNEAIEFAQPVVELRDRQAQEVEDEGGSPGERIYRALPTVHYRERCSDEYRQGVLNRSSDAPAVVHDGATSDPDVALGGESGELAQLHPPRSSATHDEP